MTDRSQSGPVSLLAALALGIGSALAFEPVGLWPLMPLAFAALCELVARAASLKRALLTGWLFGVGQFVLGLNWIATAFTFQAAMPAWLGWIAVVLVSLYLAVFPMLAAGLAWRIGREKPLSLVLALAGAWALTEWVRAGLFTGFAWNPVAVTFIDNGFAPIAGLIGTYGLSAIVALTGGVVWLASQRRRKAAFGLAVSLLVVTLTAQSLQTASLPGPKRTLPIRIVQPNIGQEDKWREGLGAEAFSRLESLSGSGPSPPRLLFWPEVAVPEPFQVLDQDTRPLPILLPALPRAIQSTRPGDVLVTGAFALIADQQGKVVGNTNSVFAIGSDGLVRGRYDKAHLVPYGEYLPMRPVLSAIGLSQLAPGIGDMTSGPGPRTLDLGRFGRMGVQVCYEIIFSGEVADRANRPDFIFNPSNDAWFGRWGPPQHLAQARLRAVEEGLPVIRATPTGISAVIAADGRLLHSLPWQAAGRIDAVLPPARAPTLFARLGNVVPVLLGFLLILAGIAVKRSRRYSPGDI